MALKEFKLRLEVAWNFQPDACLSLVFGEVTGMGVHHVSVVRGVEVDEDFIFDFGSRKLLSRNGSLYTNPVYR